MKERLMKFFLKRVEIIFCLVLQIWMIGKKDALNLFILVTWIIKKWQN